MKDITHIFNKTPLKNSTFTFFATLKSSPFIEPYYTVDYIKNFYYGSRSNTRKSIWTSMHDIAHVVDLWERGDKKRLLLTEFGWPITSNKKWPRNDLFKELRVTVLQSFLCENTFGWSRWSERSAWIKKDLRGRSHIKGNFLPTKKEWDAKVDELHRHYERIGYDALVEMWQDACAWVKAKR